MNDVDREDDVHEESDGDESSEARDDDGAESGRDVAAEVPRERARRVRRTGVDGASPSVFGAVPQGVTRFSLRRKNVHTNTWEPMTWASPGSIHAERDWPIADLSLETLQLRWGAGLYEPMWIRPGARGGRTVLLGGRQVEILHDHQATTPPAQHTAQTSDPFDGHLRFYEMVERVSSTKLSEVVQLARALGGQQQPGMSFADLRELMRDEREANAKATQEAIRLAVEPLQKQIAAWGEDDGDDGPSDAAVAGVASAGSKLFKGNKWWQQVGAFASENPGLVRDVAPVVLGAVQNVTGMIAKAVASPAPPVPAQPAPAPVPVPARARARLVEPPTTLFVEGVTNARPSSVPSPPVGASEAVPSS